MNTITLCRFLPLSLNLRPFSDLKGDEGTKGGGSSGSTPRKSNPSSGASRQHIQDKLSCVWLCWGTKFSIFHRTQNTLDLSRQRAFSIPIFASCFFFARRLDFLCLIFNGRVRLAFRSIFLCNGRRYYATDLPHTWWTQLPSGCPTARTQMTRGRDWRGDRRSKGKYYHFHPPPHPNHARPLLVRKWKNKNQLSLGVGRLSLMFGSPHGTTTAKVARNNKR